MARRLTMVLLGSGLLGAALVASIFSPQNGFLIVLVGLVFMHLFGHGGHGGGHSHDKHQGRERETD